MDRAENVVNFRFVQVHLGAGASLTVDQLDGAVTINQPKDTFYLYANIPISATTLVVNIWAIIIIRRKEKTGIHSLIVYDCIANIISFSHGFFR